MAGLVDEAHGVERAGMDGAIGMDLRVAHLVHAVGKLAAGGHVGKNDVSGIREERLRELIAFARVPRNMKFHHLTALQIFNAKADDRPANIGSGWSRCGVMRSKLSPPYE